jgi:Rrf2 family protein
MLKLTKKADYGLIAVRHLAEHSDLGACSAKDLAEMYGIPQEALAKILQRLVRSGVLTSQHGTNGGYVLARDPRKISALEVIRAIEGPLFLTSCKSAKGCGTSLKCTVREPLQKVGRAIESVLGNLTVWELQEGVEDGAVSATPHSPTAGGCGPPVGRTEARATAGATTPPKPTEGLNGAPAESPVPLRHTDGLDGASAELVRIEVGVSGGNYGK